MEQEKLPYRACDFAASLFAGEKTGLSHDDMATFFCHHLGDGSHGLEIPVSINRHKKFLWFLEQFSASDQRRLLEQLCRYEIKHSFSYAWPSAEQRDQLLQMIGGSPIQVTGTNAKWDTAGITEVWQKALDRRHEDPEGAITAARSLLESVCKRILEECGVEYGDNADLPKLYGLTSKELNLAPSQHTEEAFKKILGGAHSVVDGLANLRNRLGDAHGQGKRSVKPLPRHAELAVNMAGSMASFLLATFEART
jgi:hypothetical protein